MKVHPEVLARPLGREIVLVHFGKNLIYELNESGARVWQLLDLGYAADEIARCLASEFDVEESRAANEVEELVVQLAAEGLIIS